MSTQERTPEEDARVRTHVEAGKLLDETLVRAYKAYKEVKKQADIVYKQAKRLAVDKQAKEEADRAYKETVKQAEKVRDAILREAQAVHTAAYVQSDKDYEEAINKSKKRI
jgi:hypothetical protein